MRRARSLLAILPGRARQRYPRRNGEELIARANESVGAIVQRIKDVAFYETFPRNVAGKTLKREMRAHYAKTLTPTLSRCARERELRGGDHLALATAIRERGRRA